MHNIAVADASSNWQTRVPREMAEELLELGTILVVKGELTSISQYSLTKYALEKLRDMLRKVWEAERRKAEAGPAAAEAEG